MFTPRKSEISDLERSHFEHSGLNPLFSFAECDSEGMTPRPPTSEAWQQAWLPLFPLASDDLLGLYRMERGAALEHRYIEANPKALNNLLIVDIDHRDADLRALQTRPVPHLIVENPANGHAHAVWGLSAPIARTEYAQRKPLAYAAAAVEGLRRAVDGDKGYSGLITKNPLHASWDSMEVTSLNSLYTLDEIAAGLGDFMPPAGWRRTRARRRNPVGLGRNCSLFESARTWAYREVRNHWGDPAGLGRAIETHAAVLNAEFPVPLESNEVRTLSRSITRWITTRSRLWRNGPEVYAKTFIEIQTARSHRQDSAREAFQEVIASHHG